MINFDRKPLSFRTQFLQYESFNTKITTYTINNIISLNSTQQCINSKDTSKPLSRTIDKWGTACKTPKKNQTPRVNTDNKDNTIEKQATYQPQGKEHFFPTVKLSSNRRLTILMKRPKPIESQTIETNSEVVKGGNTKQVDLLVKLAVESNTPKNHKATNRTGKAYGKEGTGQGKVTPLYMKYKDNKVNKDIKDIKKKVKMIKGIFDYTCPLIFVAKTEIAKKNRIQMGIKRTQTTKQPIHLYDRNHKLIGRFDPNRLLAQSNDYIHTKTLHHLNRTCNDFNQKRYL